MALLDNALGRVTTNLLKRFGTPVTVLQSVDGAMNTATGVVANTTIAYPCRAVVTDIRNVGLGPGPARQSTKRFLIAQTDLPVPPKSGWAVVHGTVRFEVDTVTPLHVQDGDAAYRLDCTGTG
jgi:hypothetical protein